MSGISRRGKARAVIGAVLAALLLGLGVTLAVSAGAHPGQTHIALFEPEEGGFAEQVAIGPGDSPTADTIFEDKPLEFVSSGQAAGPAVTGCSSCAAWPTVTCGSSSTAPSSSRPGT
jgi:hypothetical protein